MYDVLRGRTAVDRWTADVPATSFTEAASSPAEGLRIAWLTRPASGPVRVHRDVRGAVEATARLLADAGHDVERVEAFPDATAVFVPQFFAAVREEAAAMAHPERLEARTRQTARRGVFARGRTLRRAVERNASLAAQMRSAFAGFDVVLTPTIACLPPRLGQLDGVGSTRALRRSLPMTAFTALANVTGLPAMSVPGARSSVGLPIGVQLCSLTDELPLLRLGAELERLRPWPLLAA